MTSKSQDNLMNLVQGGNELNVGRGSAAVAQRGGSFYQQQQHSPDTAEVTGGALLVGLLAGVLGLIFMLWCATTRRIYVARVRDMERARYQ
jgi:hypothetical protein